MSKHYPSDVTLDEMANLNEGDTIQSKFGLLTVIETHYGEIRLGPPPPDKPGPVVQRCVRVRNPDNRTSLYMVRIVE